MDTNSNDSLPIENTTDILTLELLMNKSHYKQYLAKTNPGEYRKNKEHYDKYKLHKKEIKCLLKNMIDDYDSSLFYDHGCTELQEIFTAFVKKSILHFDSLDVNNIDAENMFDCNDNHLSKHKSAIYEIEESSENISYINEDENSDLENEQILI